MKAKFVHESVKFERGRDPKRVMDIGINPIKLQPVVYTHPVYGSMLTEPEEVHAHFGDFESYQNWNYLTLDNEWKSPDDLMGNWVQVEDKVYKVPNWEELSIKRTEKEKLKESVKFERGKDPKTAMDIGIEGDIRNRWDQLQNTQGIGSVNLSRVTDSNRLYFRMWANQFPGSEGRIREAMKRVMVEYIDYDGGLFQESANLYFPIRKGVEQLFIDIYNELYPDWPLLNWEDK